MRFILRREEGNLENFLFWQRKSGELVECREIWISAGLVMALLVWFSLSYFDVENTTLFIYFSIWFTTFSAFELRCKALPAKRPVR